MKSIPTIIARTSIIWVTFFLVTIIAITTVGCKNEKPKIYGYKVYMKSFSINNIYYEYGYPKPDAGEWCKWGEPTITNSIILLDQGKKTLTIISKNNKETYYIKDSFSVNDPAAAMSYRVTAKNKNGKQCIIGIGDLNVSIVIQIMIPYEPARRYYATSFNVEKLMKEVKEAVIEKFNRVPK